MVEVPPIEAMQIDTEHDWIVAEQLKLYQQENQP
jgi:hypothetical protein